MGSHLNQKRLKIKWYCSGLVQVCRSFFGSEEITAHVREDPMDFSPSGLQQCQLVREMFPSKFSDFCKYRSALYLLIHPSSLNLCLLWGIQLFTASLCPQNFLFTFIPCPTSLSSVSSFVSLASHPQSLLPQFSLPNKFSCLLCHLTCLTSL